MRPQRKFVWTVLALLCTLMPAPARAQARASCDEHAIDPVSYALTTRGQAKIVGDPWNDWWAQERIRDTLMKFVDPAGRIKLPKASRSAGR